MIGAVFLFSLSSAIAQAGEFCDEDGNTGATLQRPTITAAPLRVGPIAFDHDATAYAQAVRRQSLTADFKWDIQGGCEFPQYAYVVVNGKRDESSKMPVEKVNSANYIGAGTGTFSIKDVVAGKVKFQIDACHWFDFESYPYENCETSLPLELPFVDTTVERARPTLPGSIIA